MGTLPAAAHSIALNLASFTFSVAVGVGAATACGSATRSAPATLALARRRGAARPRGSASRAMACFARRRSCSRPARWPALFTDAPPVIAATMPLLQIAALFQLSDGTQAIAAGALRGLGNTRATFIGNLIGHYGIGLPISLALAFGAGLGAPGLWWGLSAGLTATAIFLVQRFLAGTRGEPRGSRGDLPGAIPG